MRLFNGSKKIDKVPKTDAQSPQIAPLLPALLEVQEQKGMDYSSTVQQNPSEVKDNSAPDQVISQVSVSQDEKNSLLSVFGNGKSKSTDIPVQDEADSIQLIEGPPSESEIRSTLKPSGFSARVSEVFKPFRMQFKKPDEKIGVIEFNIGDLSLPTLDGSLRQTDVTYAIDPPFQYVNIRFDGEELVYSVLEPQLSEGENKYMKIIEKSLEKLISTKIVVIRPEEREDFLRSRFEYIIKMYGFNLNETHQDHIFYVLRKKYLGLDKIDIIMKDHYIEDISCNGPNNYLYIYHRIYGSVRTNVSFDEVELNKFVMRLAQISGKHISILQPIKDVSMPDGSRANLTLGSEVTKKGATFTIRKFRDKPMSPVELLEYGSIDAKMLAYAWILLDYHRSILVSGGTASGKTTLMNVLCSFIRPELKIVSLEDTAELNLVHPNWIQSVTRSGFGTEGDSGATSVSGVSGVSGKTPGDIGLYDLLVAALRQRPEYIIVGEVRGAEAFTLFQAIAVGHACMGTIHAGNMRELLSRVESNPMNVPRTLFSAMDAVCFSALVRRNDRNVRRVMSIMEVLELDPNGDLITNPVFRWDAFSDKFVFSGKSHIFEKIEAQLGIREEDLVNDMEQRANFLISLRKSNITDYSTTVEKIREYMLNK
jgi:flagellar protein FlaI